MAKKLSDMETGVFCRNMAMMLAAGITPAEAAALLGEDAADSFFGTCMQTLCSRMQQGEGFAQAARSSGVFSAYAVGMMGVGETTGRLEQALNSLADYYERQNALRAQLKSALLYPSVLLLLMCAVLVLMVAVVLPVFVQVYESMAGTLTGSAYGYVSAAGVIAWVSLTLTGVLCVLLLGGMLACRFTKGRQYVLSFLERFALTAPALRQIAVANLADVIATFLASGLDEDTAVAQAKGLITHRGLQKDVARAVTRMAGGESLSQSFYAEKIFEPLYGRMLLSAARSGSLDSAMGQLARQCAEDAGERLQRMIEILEPILTGFLTVSVGVTLLSCMLPLIGILSAIG